MQLTPGTAHADHSPAQEKKLSGRKYSEVVAAPRYAVLNESADPRHCGEDIVRQIKEKVNVIDLGIGVTVTPMPRSIRSGQGKKTQKPKGGYYL